MTTVAFKDGVFVSDTGTSRAGMYDGKTDKLIRTKFWTLGFAGDSYVQQKLFLFFAEDKVDALEKPLTDQTLIILAFNHNEEKLYTFNERLDRLEVKEPYFAIGSGAGFAMAALDAGAELKQAVQIAIKYDLSSFEPIKEVKAKRHK